MAKGNQVSFEEVAGELNFCDTLYNIWSEGNQGMDVDLNNLNGDESKKLLKQIRDAWKKEIREQCL